MCACDHATDFGSVVEGIQAGAEATIANAGTVSLLDLLKILLVILVVVGIDGLFVATCIYGRYLDEKDKAFARRLAFGINWDKVQVSEKTGGVDDVSCDFLRGSQEDI